jgi:hypothetical protein
MAMRLRTLVIALLSALMLGGVCERILFRFRPDRHAHLLLKDEGSDYRQVRSYFHPIWEPDTSGIIFLATAGGLYQWHPDSGGALWRFDVAADTAMPLHDPDKTCYTSVALSADGSLAVLADNSRSYGKLVEFDLATLEAKCFCVANGRISDVVFSRIDTDLVFFSSSVNGLHSVRLDGSELTSVDGRVKSGFDLTPTDSVVTLGEKPNCRVDPSGRYALFATVYDTEKAGDIGILHLKTGDTIWVPTKAYEYGDTEYASWHPNGQEIAYTAVDIQGGCPPAFPYNSPGELWTFAPLPLPE